jgi:hypothetical protein
MGSDREGERRHPGLSKSRLEISGGLYGNKSFDALPIRRCLDAPRVAANERGWGTDRANHPQPGDGRAGQCISRFRTRRRSGGREARAGRSQHQADQRLERERRTREQRASSDRDA